MRRSWWSPHKESESFPKLRWGLGAGLIDHSHAKGNIIFIQYLMSLFIPQTSRTMARWSSKLREKMLQVRVSYQNHPGITPGSLCLSREGLPYRWVSPPPGWGPRPRELGEGTVNHSIHLPPLPVCACNVTCCLSSCRHASRTRMDCAPATS